MLRSLPLDRYHSVLRSFLDIIVGGWLLRDRLFVQPAVRASLVAGHRQLQSGWMPKGRLLVQQPAPVG